MSADSLVTPLRVPTTSMGSSPRRSRSTLASISGLSCCRRNDAHMIVARDRNRPSLIRTSQPPGPLPMDDVSTTTTAASGTGLPTQSEPSRPATTTSCTTRSRPRTTMPHHSWPDKTGTSKVPALKTSRSRKTRQARSIWCWSLPTAAATSAASADVSARKPPKRPSLPSRCSIQRTMPSTMGEETEESSTSEAKSSSKSSTRRAAELGNGNRGPMGGGGSCNLAWPLRERALDAAPERTTPTAAVVEARW